MTDDEWRLACADIADAIASSGVNSKCTFGDDFVRVDYDLIRSGHRMMGSYSVPRHIFESNHDLHRSEMLRRAGVSSLDGEM